MQINSSGIGQLQFYDYQCVVSCDDESDIYSQPIEVLDGDNREVFKITRTATTHNVKTVMFSDGQFNSLNDPINVNISRNKQVTISITPRFEDRTSDDMQSMMGLVVPFASIYPPEGAVDDKDWIWKYYYSKDSMNLVQASLMIKY